MLPFNNQDSIPRHLQVLISSNPTFGFYSNLVTLVIYVAISQSHVAILFNSYVLIKNEKKKLMQLLCFKSLFSFCFFSRHRRSTFSHNWLITRRERPYILTWLAHMGVRPASFWTVQWVVQSSTTVLISQVSLSGHAFLCHEKCHSAVTHLLGRTRRYWLNTAGWASHHMRPNTLVHALQFIKACSCRRFCSYVRLRAATRFGFGVQVTQSQFRQVRWIGDRCWFRCVDSTAARHVASSPSFRPTMLTCFTLLVYLYFSLIIIRIIIVDWRIGYKSRPGELTQLKNSTSLPCVRALLCHVTSVSVEAGVELLLCDAVWLYVIIIYY